MQEGNEQAGPDQQNEDGQRQCPPPAPSRLRGALVWPPCCVAWTEFAHDDRGYIGNRSIVNRNNGQAREVER
jgi:hypothetical protein